jgi:NAD+ synthase
MRPLQAQIIAELGVRPDIDPAVEIRRRVDFLKDYLATTGTKGLVLGISGGQDSSLAGRLCQLASDELGEAAEFTAVRLPYAVQRDEDDAQLALGFIEPDRSVTFNIQRGVDGVEAEYADAIGAEMSDFTKGNVKARMRMIAQYAIAGQSGLLVVGTDHAAEAVTGFFTKYGDGGVDMLPIGRLVKSEVRALARELGVPEPIIEKPPSAGLWAGQTDEGEMGFTYEDLERYLNEGSAAVAAPIADTITRLARASEHKRSLPPMPPA